MHWTYAEWTADEDLQQGDLLAPTTEVRAILEDVHPHFCAEKYLNFIVATQSCDLVRRGKRPPKARYISIAVVRSLQEVLPNLLADQGGAIAPGLFPTSFKFQAKQFLAKLFDQNEQALGLFYLHPDADIGLGEPAVAYLRVKVALKSEHYDALIRARKGRIAPEFQAKLGWLIGNLYSRPASPDWADQEGGKRVVEQLVARHLEEQMPGAGPKWIEDPLIEAGKQAGVVFEGRDHAELLAELERHKPKPKHDQLVEHVLNEMKSVLNPSEEDLRKVRSRLINNGSIRKLVR